jgi:hypothetical protein
MLIDTEPAEILQPSWDLRDAVFNNLTWTHLWTQNQGLFHLGIVRLCWFNLKWSVGVFASVRLFSAGSLGCRPIQ